MGKTFNFIMIYAIFITIYVIYNEWQRNKHLQNQRLAGIVGLGRALSATLAPTIAGASAQVVTSSGNAISKRIEK